MEVTGQKEDDNLNPLTYKNGVYAMIRVLTITRPDVNQEAEEPTQHKGQAHIQIGNIIGPVVTTREPNRELRNRDRKIEYQRI